MWQCKHIKLIRFWSILQKFILIINTFDVADVCLILINSKYLEYLFKPYQVQSHQLFDPYYIYMIHGFKNMSIKQYHKSILNVMTEMKKKK